jgi:multiple sugar transport system permease protein
VTAVCLTAGTMAAYGFSAFGRRRAIRSMFGLIVGSRMIPPVCLIVPYALIFSRTGLTDTPLGLILACTSFQLPFAIWVMKSSFDTIPRELDEAAKIDGCDTISSFYHVSLPIARSGIATGGIMAFLFTWNEFVFAALLTRTAASKTLPIGITDFQMDDYIQWNLLAAAVICSVLPALLFIALFQKNIMSGAIAGAVKG